MGILNRFANSVQVKVFESEETLNEWLKNNGDVLIIDIKFSSVSMSTGVIRDRFLVIYSI